jgi:hypothetical protein
VIGVVAALSAFLYLRTRDADGEYCVSHCGNKSPIEERSVVRRMVADLLY